MTDAVIIDAVRTPIGKWGGALSEVRPDDMAASILRALVERNQLDPAQIEEVMLGCAAQTGEDSRNVARMALLLAGFPYEVGGVTLNRLCGSGLDAVMGAARAIKTDEGAVYIAGGVESMTRAPYVLSKAATPYDRNAQLYDSSIGWRFPNPRMEALFPLEDMGQTAENLYEQTPISRERQDAFALESQRRTIAAINTGKFKDEIVPISILQRKGDSLIVDTDEQPRMKWSDSAGQYEIVTTLESLAKLKPAFREGGTVTAGNSSSINDGAAAVLLMSADKAHELGLKPLLRVLASASAGVDPRVMGYGPIPATQKVLARTGLTIQDFDVIELNEAFAVQALAVMDALEMSPERINVNGGAIALGHPLGCSGARLVATMLHEMKRRQQSGIAASPYGLVTLCVGVGQGVAMALEWVGS